MFKKTSENFGPKLHKSQPWIIPNIQLIAKNQTNEPKKA